METTLASLFFIFILNLFDFVFILGLVIIPISIVIRFFNFKI